MIFYDQVAKLCKENGISMRRLEQKLGFGNGTISVWRNSYPTVNKAILIADYFGVSVNYLMGIEDKQETIPPELLHYVKQLNKDGIEMLIIMAKGLVITDEYKKSDISEDIQKNA